MSAPGRRPGALSRPRSDQPRGYGSSPRCTVADGPARADRDRPRVGQDRLRRLRWAARAHLAAPPAGRRPPGWLDARTSSRMRSPRATCCPAPRPPSSHLLRVPGRRSGRARSSAVSPSCCPAVVLMLALSALFLGRSPPRLVRGAGAGVERPSRRSRCGRRGRCSCRASACATSRRGRRRGSPMRSPASRCRADRAYLVPFCSAAAGRALVARAGRPGLPRSRRRAAAGAGGSARWRGPRSRSVRSPTAAGS